ncbi:sensor histidine kinase [Kitasatospora kifunensis]|uniref:histidine kinase n=1 Tax=Kitasatospora kifunensis TaxID=58351 RepID=A0A7W7RBQ6_KITKI|nr:sensor histidine kinase [Kitasatospora kifunensis]MBB4928763.1 signal transduction histidine kinase [Kitasatospora kifunensis]
MNLTRVPPKYLSRLSPGTWMVLLWFAVTAYTVFEQTQTRHGISILTLGPGAQTNEALAALVVLAAGRRKRRPLTALCLLLLGTVMSVMAMAVADIPLLQYLAVDVAVCYLAATQPARTSVTAGALALGTLLGYSGTRALSGMVDYGSTTVTAALTTVIAWLIGHAVWQSHAHAEALRARETEQAITSERLRIARELHDMVAHSIGIVALQAGAARRVFDTQPARARAALGEVEAAGRETLSGLRWMLGALREADGNAADQAEQSAPLPGLDDVARLAATTTAAGVRVNVVWSGPRRRLPPEIELSAYRIVQEAVTNVVRHAKARSCQVSIEFRAAELALSVVNAGPGPASPSPRATHGSHDPHGGQTPGHGYGIVGMRERIGLLHGEFSAEPRPGGGFRVAARLPVPQETVPASARPDVGHPAAPTELLPTMEHTL